MKIRHAVPALLLLVLGCGPVTAPSPNVSPSPGDASAKPSTAPASTVPSAPAAPTAPMADSIAFSVAGAAVAIPNRVELNVSGNGATWDVNAPDRVAPPGEYYVICGVGTTKGLNSPTFSTEEITTVSLVVGQGFQAGKLDRKWMKVGGDIKATVVNGKVDFSYKGEVTKAPGSSEAPETLDVDLLVKGLPIK